MLFNIFLHIFVERKSKTMPNTKIFISTHKPFNMLKKLPRENYTIITNGIPLKTDLYDVIVVPKEFRDELGGYSDAEYSEVYMLKYLRKHQELLDGVDYVGLNHYRRVFEFQDKVPQLSDDGYDCVLPKPLKFGLDLYTQYAFCHNGDDLRLFAEIIKEINEEVGDAFDKYLQGNKLFEFNMFVVKKELFNDVIDFEEKSINAFIRRRGNIQEYINNHKDLYLKDFSPNNELWYQYRILGYLCERFCGFYINHVSKNPLLQKVGLLEGKYGYDF